VVRKAGAITGARVTAAETADVVVQADPERLTQALLQLAQNAVTHGGGDIVIGSRQRAGAVEFWVRDHGPGVPDDAKPLVFERFHRGGADGVGPVRVGSGLGLNIVQVIARAHGGSARVQDAVGGGAVFILSIPHEDAGEDDRPALPIPTPVPATEER